MSVGGVGCSVSVSVSVWGVWGGVVCGVCGVGGGGWGGCAENIAILIRDSYQIVCCLGRCVGCSYLLCGWQ